MNIVVVRAVLRPEAKSRLKPFPFRNADAKAIGQWLRRLRKRTAMTVGGMATLLGCDRARVLELERGETEPPVAMLALYLEELGYEFVATNVRCSPSSRHIHPANSR